MCMRQPADLCDSEDGDPDEDVPDNGLMSFGNFNNRSWSWRFMLLGFRALKKSCRTDKNFASTRARWCTVACTPLSTALWYLRCHWFCPKIWPVYINGLWKKTSEVCFSTSCVELNKTLKKILAKHYLGAQILDLSTLLVRDYKLNAEPSAGENHPIIQTWSLHERRIGILDKPATKFASFVKSPGQIQPNDNISSPPITHQLDIWLLSKRRRVAKTELLQQFLTPLRSPVRFRRRRRFRMISMKVLCGRKSLASSTGDHKWWRSSTQVTLAQ